MSELYNALVHVPGSFRCPKCRFVQMFSTVRASDGAVGVNLTPDPERMVCPNDGEPLRPLTWQERATEAEDGWGACLAENTALRAEVARLREALTPSAEIEAVVNSLLAALSARR